MSQDLRDDLVRRGDVMDELVKEYNKRWQEGGLKLAWIEKAVDSARPVADVRENVRGKWIEEPNCWYRCSNCGEHYPSIRGYIDYNYCPFCGATMERGVKNEQIH